MIKENDSLHDLCEVLLMEEKTQEANPDDQEMKTHIAAIKVKKQHLVHKINFHSPVATQEQVDECNSRHEQSLSYSMKERGL